MKSLLALGIAGLFVTFFIALGAENALAAGGTSMVATKGQPAHVSTGWPDGVGKLVNNTCRTKGWNAWFTEWPNDVNQYAMQTESTADLNRLLAALAAVKTDLRQVRLSYLKEPNGLGWVTKVPEGNNIPVVFSIGDQSRVDEWFKSVRKPFGVMEFTAAPIAVPPTLTIFVQNKAVKLDELKIPAGLDVSIGYVPMVFHRSNTKLEQQQKGQGQRAAVPSKEGLDEASLAALKKIEAFLESHQKETRQP